MSVNVYRLNELVPVLSAWTDAGDVWPIHGPRWDSCLRSIDGGFALPLNSPWAGRLHEGHSVEVRCAMEAGVLSFAAVICRTCPVFADDVALRFLLTSTGEPIFIPRD